MDVFCLWLQINMMLANLYRKAGQERSAVTSYKEVLRQCPLALDAIIGTERQRRARSHTLTHSLTCMSTALDETVSCAGLLSLSVKGADVASMTMDVIQSIPNLDWLSVWVKAYAFIHAGDNQRAINTIWSAAAHH